VETEIRKANKYRGEKQHGIYYLVVKCCDQMWKGTCFWWQKGKSGG